MTLSKVGAIESSEATELLTSSLNGYKKEANEAMSVVDKISSIDLAAATSSYELATALARTANSANDAGVSFDKLLAMIGTVSSVTRKSASTIGESFKTIFARMGNVAAGKDTDDMGEPLNDVEKTLNKMDIALRTSEGEWRNFETVLDEVAERWKDFNSTEQSQIATAIAGVRQQENFRALMNNWKEVERLTGVAANSTGSATERMGIYLDSIEAKTNNLKNVWEGFVMSLNQSDSYKNFLDLCIWILNNMDTVIGLLTSFFITIQGEKMFSKTSGIVKKVIEDFGAFISIIKETKVAGSGFKGTISAMGKALVDLKGAGAVAAGGIGLVIGALTLAVSAYNKYKQAQLDAVSETKEQTEKIREERTSLDEVRKEYSNIINSSADLSDKKNQLQDIQGELNNLFDDEKTKVDLVNGSYKEQLQILQDLEREKVFDEANQYNQGENTRQKVLDTMTSNTIYDFDPNSTVGKKVLEVAKKYSTMPVIPETQSNGFSSETILDISTNAENLVKIYQELQEAAKNWSEEEQQELGKYLTSSDWLQNSIEEDYNKFKESFDEEQKAQLANFQKDNWTAVSEYKSRLLTMQELQEQYNKATDEKEKEKIAKQIQNLDETIKVAKEKLYGLTDDTAIKSALDTLFNSLTQYSNPFINFESLGVDGVDNNFFNKIENEVKNLGNLSKDTEEKILELAEAMSGSDVDSSWLSTYEQKLKDIGININKIKISQGLLVSEYEDAEKNGMYSGDVEGGGNDTYLNSLGHARTMVSNTKEYIASEEQKKTEKGSAWTVNNQENLDRLKAQLLEYQNVAMSYFNEFYGDLDEQLAALGVNGGDVMIMSLKTKLATGEEDIGAFYSQLSEYLKTLGIDIENLAQDTQNEINGINFNFKESIGTDEEFSEIPNQLDSLYSAKQKINEGDNLDYEEYRDLVDNFEDLADIVDETGDVTAITGEDIQDVIDNIVEKTEEDLDAMQELFDETIENIDNIINKAKFPDEFSDVVNNAMKKAEDALKDGEKLSFLDPDIVSDTGALTDYASEIDNISDALETMSISAEDAQTKLYLLGLEALDGQTQADALGLMISLLGTDFNTMDASVQQALIDLGLYNQETGMADSTQMVTTLSNIANNFDTADEKTQQALTTLLQYITTIGVAENASPESQELSNLIGSALGEIKAAAKVGSREVSVRRAGLRNTNASGKKSSSSGSDYSAEDAAEDLRDILEDIEDYEADIELDLEDQTEQLINHYNLEKNKLESLKEELDYYEGIYDSVENTTKWLETQSKLLENQSNMVEELQKSNDKIEKQREKIYRENSGYNVSGWFDSEGNDTLAYGDLINSFEYQKNAIQKETAAQMRDVYNSVAGSTSEDAIENAKDRIEELQKAADKRLEALDKEREKVENIHDSVSELNDAWDENQEAIRDALADMHDRIIDMRDTLVDQMMEQLEKAVDKQNESIEKDVTRMEQLVSIREKYYDILNETIDTQAELDSELQSSLDSFEYLDEQMRQLMFNEEDYKVLSETLTGIQEDIADIWEDHYAQIDSLTDDEMYKAEYITAETERQLEMKMQEYELAKAELDVAKARTNLQNVQNERNVRMFVNGQWTWVADPDAVKDAQQQLADAEREKNRIEREAEQQRLIDSMDKIIDSDNLQIDENNELLERVQEAIELQTQEVQSIEQALENIANTDLPAVGDVLQGAFGADGKSGWISELLQNINKSTSGLTLALKGYTVASAENALKNGSLSKSEFNDLVSKLGYSFNETTGIVTTPEGSFSAHYKGWTQKNNNDVQLGTANNGVQVTGGGSNANGSGGGSNASGFPRSGHVSTSSLPLRIRSGAGTNYKVLGLMPKGAAVTITGEANSGWAKVQYNGINGYASRQYLTYDQGGVAIGKGMFLKDVNVPERILSPKQTKSFDYLVKNLTTNPVLAALTKNPNITSNLNGLGGTIGETKQYYFSNFTVQADNLTEFIDSLDAMIPISRK